jgi:hypothetical protein
VFHLMNLERGGPTKNMVTTLEGDVDVALLWAYRLEHHPLRSVIDPLWGLQVSENEQLLRRLATYRSTHPSPLRADALAKDLPESTPEAREVLDGARENERIIGSMVAKYAAQPQTSK